MTQTGPTYQYAADLFSLNRHAHLSLYQVLSRQSMCILCSLHISYSPRRVVSVSVHGEQTQSRLLEKTHQSNGNLHKNDSVLMPKCEFKLASNPAQLDGGGARACGEPSMS